MNTPVNACNNNNDIILSLLSEGLSSEMILAKHPEIEHSDILKAAEQALPTWDRFSPLNPSIDNLLINHPRAFAAWKEEEDKTLLRLRTEGHTIFEISRFLKRHPSAIYTRMQDLGILN